MRRCGQVAAVLSTVALVIMQILADDWLPAQISVSQYAFGPAAGAYLMWLAGIAGAALCWGWTAQQRWVQVVLLVGGLTILVAIAVPTDVGGAQQSIPAKVHMVASGFALVLLPAGSAGMLPVRWRMGGLVTLGVSYLALVALLVAAFGFDVFGIGANPSWALAQGIAVIANQILLLAVASGTRLPRLGLTLAG